MREEWGGRMRTRRREKMSWKSIEKYYVAQRQTITSSRYFIHFSLLLEKGQTEIVDHVITSTTMLLSQHSNSSAYQLKWYSFIGLKLFVDNSAKKFHSNEPNSFRIKMPAIFQVSRIIRFGSLWKNDTRYTAIQLKWITDWNIILFRSYLYTHGLENNRIVTSSFTRVWHSIRMERNRKYDIFYDFITTTTVELKI